MNERTALVCMEQKHRECMITLKVEINLSVESNCLCSRVEGKL